MQRRNTSRCHAAADARRAFRRLCLSIGKPHPSGLLRIDVDQLIRAAEAANAGRPIRLHTSGDRR